MRNIILDLYCLFANAVAFMCNSTHVVDDKPYFTVHAALADCDEPQEGWTVHTELAKFWRLADAMEYVFGQERTTDPDAYWWVEESGTNNVYDADSYDPCGYCGTSNNPNDICRTCFNGLE